MSQDNKDQTLGNSPEPAGIQTEENQSSTTAERISEIDKKLAEAASAMSEKAKVVGAEALNFAKHHSCYTELGASLAESMAGESLGEIVGAGLGSVLGPEGTVIGAELGGMAGEVFGARQGEKAAKKLLHDSDCGPPLNEDLQKEGSAKITGKAGKQIGGLIGDILFDDAGGEIGQAVGEKIGKLAGSMAYERIEKQHRKNKEKILPNDDIKTDLDFSPHDQ